MSLSIYVDLYDKKTGKEVANLFSAHSRNEVNEGLAELCTESLSEVKYAAFWGGAKDLVHKEPAKDGYPERTYGFNVYSKDTVSSLLRKQKETIKSDDDYLKQQVQRLVDLKLAQTLAKDHKAFTSYDEEISSIQETINDFFDEDGWHAENLRDARILANLLDVLNRYDAENDPFFVVVSWS